MSILLTRLVNLFQKTDGKFPFDQGQIGRVDYLVGLARKGTNHFRHNPCYDGDFIVKIRRNTKNVATSTDYLEYLFIQIHKFLVVSSIHVFAD